MPYVNAEQYEKEIVQEIKTFVEECEKIAWRWRILIEKDLIDPDQRISINSDTVINAIKLNGNSFLEGAKSDLNLIEKGVMKFRTETEIEESVKKREKKTKEKESQKIEIFYKIRLLN